MVAPNEAGIMLHHPGVGWITIFLTCGHTPEPHPHVSHLNGSWAGLNNLLIRAELPVDVAYETHTPVYHIRVAGIYGGL